MEEIESMSTQTYYIFVAFIASQYKMSNWGSFQHQFAYQRIHIDILDILLL